MTNTARQALERRRAEVEAADGQTPLSHLMHDRPRCQAVRRCPDGCTEQRCEHEAAWGRKPFDRAESGTRVAGGFYCEQCATELVARGACTAADLLPMP